MALDQLGVDAEQVRPSPRSSRRRRCRRRTPRRPGARVRRAASRPAAARLGEAHASPAQQPGDLLVDRGPVLAEQVARRGARRTAARTASAAASAPSRWRTSISSSPRRRQVVISSADRSVSPLDLAQGLGDLRLGDAEQAQRVAAETASPASSTARTRLRRRSAAGHIACSSRGGPGQDDHRGPVGRDHQAGRGPGRVDRGRARAAPSPACGWPRAAPRGRSATAARSRARIAAIFSSISSSSTSSRPGEAARRPRPSGRRRSGPSPPLVTIRSTPSAARKRSAASRSSGRSPTHEDVGDLDAQLAEPLARSRGRCGR